MGIDIKDIPKIDDKEFSITLNAFFVVRWMDRRMSINQEKLQSLFKQGTLYISHLLTQATIPSMHMKYDKLSHDAYI